MVEGCLVEYATEGRIANDIHTRRVVKGTRV